MNFTCVLHIDEKEKVASCIDHTKNFTKGKNMFVASAKGMFWITFWEMDYKEK